MSDTRRPAKTALQPGGLTAPASGGPVSSAEDISRFLQSVEDTRSVAVPEANRPRGRLIFALDATMSRQATWDRAQHIQSEMFEAAARLTGLEIKLVYFRGFGECRASRWMVRADDLGRAMSGISCAGGRTQIGKVLKSALDAAREAPVQALVYVGDCMEEDIDQLCARAGELGLLRVPLFLFQEGDDPVARQAFAELARLSGGAHCAFTSGSAAELAALLRAVAVYASGGREELRRLEAGGGAGAQGARALLARLPRNEGRSE